MTFDLTLEPLKLQLVQYYGSPRSDTPPTEY
jgi:hypothetical protein